VFVGHQELADAFSMLDVENSGVITVSNLKKRLGVFFPDLSAKEYRFMMNNKKELSLDDLHELLDRNDIANFDPLEEAFKLPIYTRKFRGTHIFCHFRF
jgi:Ca2+-binding EF-hand superfamily protein